uniref:hypothetical protein n=1 Tax=Candidatus Fimivicinus sp. TaxID=3056640 RepID=UPI003FF11B94
MLLAALRNQKIHCGRKERQDDYFRPAEQFGIQNADGLFAAALQALVLYPGALDPITGRFLEEEACVIDPDEAEKFDQSFPQKEKSVMLGQARFLELVQMVHE